MTILAIETSCDETAVAILRNENPRSGSKLLASEVASQIAEHEKFGGVVPEVASRNHLAQLPRLLERAIASANIAIDDIDAFAATSGPGLASSLLVGNSAAKGLAIGAGKPFLAINHLEGHLLSPFFGRETLAAVEEKSRYAERMSAMTGETPVFQRHVALVVSGGHTLLVNVRGVGDYEILGRTLDDAAGEAFDKVAKLLGLGYPGGPEIEMRAQEGDAKKFDLPRSMLNSGDLNFSFSGLKTAVRYLLPKVVIPSENASAARTEGSHHESLKVTHRDPSTDARDDRVVNDLCASFQHAVIDILREKSLRALQQTKSRLLTMSGGVSCNRALRENLRAVCEKSGIEFLVAEPWLCTDNAAMIAFAAIVRFQAEIESSLADEIDPNLALA
jgi:N6-L-threonylcarbamoyladenine synthase